MRNKKKPRGAGAALQRWMRGREISAPELAEKIGVSRIQIHSYISGAKRPNLDHAAELERITGIPARRWAERPA